MPAVAGASIAYFVIVTHGYGLWRHFYGRPRVALSLATPLKGAIEGLTLFIPAWHIVLPAAMWDT